MVAYLRCVDSAVDDVAVSVSLKLAKTLENLAHSHSDHNIIHTPDFGGPFRFVGHLHNETITRGANVLTSWKTIGVRWWFVDRSADVLGDDTGGLLMVLLLLLLLLMLLLKLLLMLLLLLVVEVMLNLLLMLLLMVLLLLVVLMVVG